MLDISFCGFLLLLFLFSMGMFSAFVSSVGQYLFTENIQKSILAGLIQVVYTIAFSALLVYGNYWLFIGVVFVNSIIILLRNDKQYNYATGELEHSSLLVRVLISIISCLGATLMFYIFQWIA